VAIENERQATSEAEPIEAAGAGKVKPGANLAFVFVAV
jgi:hypothetical protein